MLCAGLRVSEHSLLGVRANRVSLEAGRFPVALLSNYVKLVRKSTKALF